MSTAPLPRGPRQGGADRTDQPGVSVGGDEFDSGQAAGGQGAQEGQPASSVLGGGDVDTEDFAVALGVDPDCDQRVHVDHPTSLTHLEHQGVCSDERVWAGV